jgi:circadian clock protein KaiC
MRKKSVRALSAKAPTGILGLDSLTEGGFPRGRATLLVGGAGSGKTVIALQTLVEAARTRREPGIFVAFEESRARIVANAETFGWKIPALEKEWLFFLDAAPSVDTVATGSFDLNGLLAILDTLVARRKATRIVFDSVDMVLRLLRDPVEQRRELIRLNDWLIARGLSAIFTAKTAVGSGGEDGLVADMQFMVDCVVRLDTSFVEGLAHRTLRVSKFRGSGYIGNETPYVIAREGVDVAESPTPAESVPKISSKQRVSTGIVRLDAMLTGGVYRGSATLISGAPGTAKTSIAGAFINAACRRGERALYICYDSSPGDILRNLACIGLNLAPWVQRGLLEIHSDRSRAMSAELQFTRIRRLAIAHRARTVVVDPISALGKTGTDARTYGVIERLTDWARSEGITLLLTSLSSGPSAALEATSMQVSTIADTWIYLSYLVHAGERNRALAIVKSRGTKHSNQVRELLLSDTGVTLRDVYSAGGEVLMGTLRSEYEQEVERLRKAGRRDDRRKRRDTDNRIRELESEAVRITREIEHKRAERSTTVTEDHKVEIAAAEDYVARRHLRRADSVSSEIHS